MRKSRWVTTGTYVATQYNIVIVISMIAPCPARKTRDDFQTTLTYPSYPSIISIHQNSKYRYLPTYYTDITFHRHFNLPPSTTFSADEEPTRGTFFEPSFVHSLNYIDDRSQSKLMAGRRWLFPQVRGYGFTTNEMDGYILRTDTWMDCNLHRSNRIERGFVARFDHLII